MFGFISRQQALAEGFTHHGSYYGIPIWITEAEEPMVCAKWMFGEWLITVAAHIEGFIYVAFMPGVEPMFTFLYKGKIIP